MFSKTQNFYFLKVLRLAFFSRLTQYKRGKAILRCQGTLFDLVQNNMNTWVVEEIEIIFVLREIMMLKRKYRKFIIPRTNQKCALNARLICLSLYHNVLRMQDIFDNEWTKKCSNP